MLKLDRHTTVLIMFFILIGGLITVKDSLGYPGLIICFTLNVWGAVIANQLMRLNGDE